MNPLSKHFSLDSKGLRVAWHDPRIVRLNGRRAHFVIALSLVTCERAIRNHAVLPHFSQGSLRSQHEIKLFRFYEL